MNQDARCLPIPAIKKRGLCLIFNLSTGRHLIQCFIHWRVPTFSRSDSAEQAIADPKRLQSALSVILVRNAIVPNGKVHQLDTRNRGLPNRHRSQEQYIPRNDQLGLELSHQSWHRMRRRLRSRHCAAERLHPTWRSSPSAHRPTSRICLSLSLRLDGRTPLQIESLSRYQLPKTQRLQRLDR